MVAPQVVEVRGETGKAAVLAVEAPLDQADVLAGLRRVELPGNAALHDVIGHRRTQQAGQVGLDAVAQLPQRVGPALGFPQAQVLQGPVHFRRRGLVAQCLGQSLAEFGGAGQAQ